MTEWNTECGVHHGIAMAAGSMFALLLVALFLGFGLSGIEAIYAAAGIVSVTILAEKAYRWWQPPDILDEYDHV